jgi:ectoine hydroxylase
MKLEKEQLDFFEENGYLLIHDLFTAEEADVLLNEMSDVIKEDCPRRILEKNGSVRSFFAPHFTNRVMDKAARDGRLVGPCSQLLNGDIYLYQAKLNTKAAMSGDWWEWHQDYTFWKQDDGMPGSNVLTAMIFLNDVTEFNGPLLVIPGSHKAGTVDSEENKIEIADEKYRAYVEEADYLTALTSDLKYTLKNRTIRKWAKEKGIVSAKGRKGSVLIFHGNIFHASSNNLSPWDRHTYLLTYNHVENQPEERENPRPDFIANRNAAPLRVEELEIA